MYIYIYMNRNTIGHIGCLPSFTGFSGKKTNIIAYGCAVQFRTTRATRGEIINERAYQCKDLREYAVCWHIANILCTHFAWFFKFRVAPRLDSGFKRVSRHLKRLCFSCPFGLSLSTSLLGKGLNGPVFIHFLCLFSLLLQHCTMCTAHVYSHFFGESN